MSFSVAQTYLADILHVISQALLIPVIVLLIGLIAYGLFSIGSVVSEYFTERRHFKVVMPKFLAALMEAKQDEIPQVIEESGLLKRQKTALLTVYEYRTLPGDALIALIKRLVSEEESHYDRIRSRNNTAARVAPMIGLMGTLIPLGPGIEALGRADTAALSSSLLIAFDTTVAGLIVAAVCMVIGKIRGNWYDNYLSALDSAMATMLEKIEEMRAAGEIKTQEPASYDFMFNPNADKSAAGSARGTRAQTSQPSAAAPSSAIASSAETSDPLELIGIPRVAPAPAPEPQPQSQFQLQPEPQPQIQPQPEPQSQFQLQPEPEPQPQFQLQPEPAAAPAVAEPQIQQASPYVSQAATQAAPQETSQEAPQEASPAPVSQYIGSMTIGSGSEEVSRAAEQPASQPSDSWTAQPAEPMPSYSQPQDGANGHDVLFEPPRRPRELGE